MPLHHPDLICHFAGSADLPDHVRCAWSIDMSDSGTATFAAWLLHIPYVDPQWQNWMVSAVRLPAALDGRAYEFVSHAVDWSEAASFYDLAPASSTMHQRFTGPTERDARSILDQCVLSTVSGRLSPNQTDAWKALIKRELIALAIRGPSS